MPDSTPTRTETVTANIEAVVNKYGEENYMKLLAVCLQDISLSLATLVDNAAQTES